MVMSIPRQPSVDRRFGLRRRIYQARSTLRLRRRACRQAAVLYFGTTEFSVELDCYPPSSRFHSPAFFSGTGSAWTVREAPSGESAARDFLTSVVKRVNTVGSTARSLLARVIAT
jgi:hypothetical protein